MKQLTLLVVFIFGLGCTPLFAQDHVGFKKGDMFVSGMVGYSSVSHPDDSKEHNFNITPRFGYFLNDFIAVGGKLGYGIQTQKNSSGDKVVDNTTLGFEVFGRYYLLPGSKFSVFGEVDLGYGFTRDIHHDWSNGINVGLLPGLSYFVGRHVALEASFGILSYNSVSIDGQSGSTDNFKVGLNLEDINFGIIIKF